MPRKKNQGSKWITKSKRWAIYFRDNCECVYCGRSLNDGAILTLDHIVPCEALPVPNNKHTNLVTACLSCNSSKNAKSLNEYMDYLRAFGASEEKISSIMVSINCARAGYDTNSNKRKNNTLYINGYMKKAKLFLQQQK
jgi:hypothetical protein